MSGTWQPLNNQPTFNASTMLLLTDGTVMCSDEGSSFAGTSHWWKLIPNAVGSYIDGTWSQLADGPNSPLFFASAVLKDGRVFVAGGEYNGSNVQSDLLTAEIYNPVANTWTSIATPTGWSNIGDASCCVFPDGRVLIGSINDSRNAIYDPVANTWTAAANKKNIKSNEETWTLLPDQTILTVDCFGHPQTEKYIIVADSWITLDSTPTDLVEDASKEVGPAVLLPDGRVFAIGATGNTALYTMPPVANQRGNWANGPTFPPQVPGQTLGAKDAPACLLPNGRVLCAVGPVDGKLNPDGTTNYLSPTYFFEFDPTSSTLTPITNPSNNGQAPFNGRMLLLPTGQVLFANGSTTINVYTPDGVPDPAWKPSIISHPGSLLSNHVYNLSGRQLNGLSQAVSYGDDATMATNYPLVRLSNVFTGIVTYCRTFNHSSMGVATGSITQSTQFRVPAGLGNGSYQLSVVANGIASDPVSVHVGVKIVKEIKFEIKEFKEKENFKHEIDVVVKNAIENKNKDDETGLGQLFGQDPEWIRAIRLMAERSDRVEELLVQQRAFIREEDRPELGEQALLISETEVLVEMEAKTPEAEARTDGDGKE
jgi:hypothetical protein